MNVDIRDFSSKEEFLEYCEDAWDDRSEAELFLNSRVLKEYIKKNKIELKESCNYLFNYLRICTF